MKAPRLTRSKSRHDSAARSSSKSRERQSPKVKTSFDDLRTPDGRERLRQQLSNLDPALLKSSPSTASMGGNWDSSSSLESNGNGNGPKRLSALPEQQNPAAIDVDQAINLLMELKKTATPDQLVALHKALLPTRDSFVPSESPPANGKRASLIRQSSMLPPGLATRGGASDDLLRRQEDVKPVPRKNKTRSEGHLRRRSKSIDALDLADDTANPLAVHPAFRTATSNDDKEHYFGGFRPGTLRITNGAASPEPSLRPKPSGDFVGLAVSDEQIAIGRARAESLAEEILDAQAEREPVSDSPKRRAQTFHGQEGRPLFSQTKSRTPSLSSSHGPSPSRSRETSQTRQKQPTASPPESAASTTPVARSREPSLTRVPFQLDAPPSRQSLSATKKASVDTLLRRSIESFTIRKSFDDGRISPLDAPPRFSQRWAHRASQISQEYMNDCEVPVSPFEDRQQAQALAFAQRLSTVFDGEDEQDTAAETPEAALSRLEGAIVQAREETEERRSLRATAEGLNSATRPQLISRHSAGPRPMPSKADSGYVSDASRRSAQRKNSYDASRRFSRSPVNQETPSTESEPPTPQVELGTQMKVFQVPQQSPAPTPSPRPDASRKHSSFQIRLPGLKKSKLADSTTILDVPSSTESPRTSDDAAASSPVASPAEIKNLNPSKSKKLQKRMPEEMRQQRRALREQAKQKALNLESTGPDARFSIGTSAQNVSSPLPVSEPPTPSMVMPSAVSLVAESENMPAELAGDAPQPPEVPTDESDIGQRRLSWVARKSRRRSRTNTVTATTASATPTATDTEDAADPKQRKRSFSLGRKRDRSKSRSGSTTPKEKRKSKDIPAVPSIAALSAMFIDNGSQDSLPLHTDHSSVSRALGSNPYDISTAMFKRNSLTGSSTTLASEVQSPHQISSAWPMSPNGSAMGMDAAMASEFARRKSRDVAMSRNEELYDRPRMATPRKRNTIDAVPMANRTSTPNAGIVDQRNAAWNSKPVFRNGSVSALHDERPHSIAESIPPMPELPAVMSPRVPPAKEMLPKRPKGMESASSLVLTPSSLPSPDPSATQDPGFENESIADAIAKAVEARRAKRKELIKQAQQSQADRLRPEAPPVVNNARGSTANVSLQHHTPDERPHSDASASILIGVGSDRDEQEGRPGTATTITQEPAEMNADEPSVWERQAELWRQKRESITRSMTTPVNGNTTMEESQPVNSPSIVISPTSTASARDSLPSARRRRPSTSEQHAKAYRALVRDHDNERTPPASKRASTTSTSTITGDPTGPVTLERATTAKAYQSSPIARIRSPGGRVRTESGDYHPYAPSHAAAAERSRASMLVQNAGQFARSTRSLDINTQRKPHHQKINSLDSIITPQTRALSPVPASDAGSVATFDEPERGPGEGPMSDRYAGGLQYGYEKGVGLQGSSGLRSKGVSKAQNRGDRFSAHFGLDLGDVPMFLRRAGAA